MINDALRGRELEFPAPASLYPYEIRVQQRADRKTVYVTTLWAGSQVAEDALFEPTLDAILQSVTDAIRESVFQLAARSKHASDAS